MLKNTLQDIKWVLWTILIIIRCMNTDLREGNCDIRQ